MNEIQCYAYLKQALDTEDYEAADLIRKRMENFR
jgi:protein-arginine kinase activator protein McsA